MTDPRDHDPERPTPPPHGMAGGLREELAEVVEHVPKPVRWTVARIAWLVAGGVLALVAVALVTVGLYVANRTEWVAAELSLFLNQTLARRSDVVVQVQDLRGNPLTGMTLIEPRVRFRDARGPALLEARRVEVAYGLWGLLTGRASAVEVRAEHPVVRLTRGPDGRVRLPRWRAGARGGRPRPLDVRVVLHAARIEAPAGMDGVEDLHADVEVRTGRVLRATVHRMAWGRGPAGTRLDRLRATFERSDSVRIAVRELTGPELALRGRAAWAAAGGERVAHVEVARLRWALLARVFRNGALDVPGEVAATVDARGERAWDATFRTRLTWDGLPATGSGRARWADGRLRLDPLVASSLAGDLRGWVTHERAGWAVGGDVDRGDPSRWEAINVPGWPAGRLHGWFRYAVDTRVKGRPSATLTARLGGSALAGWQVDSARVAVAFPWREPVAFSVAALRRGGTFTLDAATTAGGWAGDYVVRGLPLEEWPDGRATGLSGVLGEGEGTVRAEGGALSVTGTLEGTSGAWLGMDATRWRLERVDGRLLPTPNLSAVAQMRDLTYLGVHFDSAAVAFALGDRVAALQRVQAWAGDTLVRADGHARWDAAGWTLGLDRAALSSARFDWTAEGPVRLWGDPRGVTFERLEARDGEARLSVRGRWAAPPHGTYDWTLEGRGLEVGRLGLPSEWGLGGRADVRLDVTGASGDPRWTLRADCSHPAARGHAADSLHLALAGGPGRAELRRGSFALGGGRVEGTLRVEGTREAWPDTLTFDGIVAWMSGAAAWDGSFRADALPLAGLEAFAPQARGMGGALTATLGVGGAPGRPELAAEGAVTAPRWGEFVAEALTGRARYRDGRLSVESLRMADRTLASEVTGWMPLEIGLGRPPRVPESPMAWRVEVPAGDLALVPLFVPQVASARGRFEAHATLEGTARHPRLDGYARVRDAAVRLQGREEVLDRLSADFRFTESRVALDSLRARQGARGTVWGSGRVQLAGLGLEGYRFDLHLRDFTAAEQGLYAAAFDGDFVVTDGPRLHGQTLPMVEGTVRLDRAAVLFDFANQSEMERLAATTQPLFWVYRVQVEASDNLHWQPPAGDLEFSADLSVEQTTDSLLVFGEMRALRGTYWFLSNRFTVERADLVFDNVAGVDPTLDVVATTRIVARPDPGPEGLAVGRADTRPVTHTVTAAIQGRSSKPGITLWDDQGWDDATILRQMTLGTFAGPEAIGDALDNYVTRALNRTLSAEMSRRFQGYVNEWTLERERGGLFTGSGDVVATVGVPITRNLSLRYRSRIGLAQGQDTRLPGGSSEDLFERNLEAEYRLNRFFYVTTEYVQRRVLTGSAATVSGTPDFNVNLKARWEY